MNKFALAVKNGELGNIISQYTKLKVNENELEKTIIKSTLDDIGTELDTLKFATDNINKNIDYFIDYGNRMQDITNLTTKNFRSMNNEINTFISIIEKVNKGNNIDSQNKKNVNPVGNNSILQSGLDSVINFLKR
jgi:hypothetical protein